MQVEHQLYKRAPQEEADAVAWVFTSKDSEMELYPFKFPKIGVDEVRAKILHASICHSDVMQVRGGWGPINYPCCPGHQVVAQITILGENVTEHKVGDYIGVTPLRYSDMTCRACTHGNTNLCDNLVQLYGGGPTGLHFGGFCTHMQIDKNWAIPIPQGLDLREIAPLMCAGGTVFNPLKKFGKPGKRVAVIGIGGLGHLAIQYANKLGMKVTAFTTKVNDVAPLKEFGADSAEHSTDLAQLKLNQGKYDIVLSMLFVDDPALYTAHQRLVAPGGVYVILGVPALEAKYQVDAQYLIDNEIGVVGSCGSSIADAKEMLGVTANHDIKCKNEHFEFENFPKAFERSEKGNPRFRVVVHVEEWAKKNGFDK